MAEKKQVSEALLEYCNTQKQTELVSACLEHGSVAGAARHLGIDGALARRTIRAIEARAEKDLYSRAPTVEHETPVDREKYPLIGEMVKNDHAYTEDELIQIVRALKLDAPSRFITRSFFREATQIPDSAWTQGTIAAPAAARNSGSRKATVMLNV